MEDKVCRAYAGIVRGDKFDRYAALDFSRDPEPPLATADAQWLDGSLRRAGLRK